MNTTNKIKLRSWDDVGQILEELDSVETSLTAKTAEKNKELESVDNKYNSTLEKLTARKEEIEQAVNEYALANRKSIGGVTKNFHNGCSVAVDKCPPALALTGKNDTEKKAAERIQQHYKKSPTKIKRYIKAEPKMIKNNLKADILDGDISKETAKELGLKVQQDLYVKITLSKKKLED